MSTAGDMHHKGPLVGLHEYTGSLGTGGVVGGGTAAVGALHAAAGRLLHPLLTVVTFLSRIQTQEPRLSKVQRMGNDSRVSGVNTHKGR